VAFLALVAAQTPVIGFDRQGLNGGGTTRVRAEFQPHSFTLPFSIPQISCVSLLNVVAVLMSLL